MTALTLYEIAGAHKELADKLMNLDLPDDVIADTLGAESGLVEKAQSYGFVIRNLEAYEAAVSADANRQMLRAKQAHNRAAAIKQRLLDAMLYTNTQRIEHPQFVISVAKNPTAVEIFDEAQIPADYMNSPPPPAPRPDKTLIKKAIADGFDVPGAKLVQGVRLSIK